MKTRRIRTDILYNGVDANVDISSVLADFSFSDSTEESDSISLTLNDREEKWSGAWMPENGDKIRAGIVLENWRYEGEKKKFAVGSLWWILTGFRLRRRK